MHLHKTTSGSSFEFFHKETLQQLLDILHQKEEFCVQLSGVTGCGKTVILTELYNEICSKGKNVLYFNWLQQGYDHTILEKNDSNLNDVILIVDGIDSMRNLKIQLQHLKNFRKIYVSSQDQNFYKRVDFLHFTDFINITSSTSSPLFTSLVSHYLHSLKIEESTQLYIEILDSIKNLPDNFTKHEIFKRINHYIDSNNLLRDTIVNLDSESTQGYKLGEGLILNSPKLFIPDKPDIVLPEPIVTDLNTINTSLLSRVANKPSLIHECTSREFEELVCEMLDKKGYKVNLTQQTRDGGKDIIIIEDNLIGSFLIYVECKKYAPDRPVGVNLVRELYGTISADKATAGLLITTSYFSQDAINFKNQVSHQLSLIDYVKLISEIQKIC